MVSPSLVHFKELDEFSPAFKNKSDWVVWAIIIYLFIFIFATAPTVNIFLTNIFMVNNLG